MEIKKFQIVNISYEVLKKNNSKIIKEFKENGFNKTIK